MRGFLWRSRELSILLFVLGLMTVLGCEQSGSGESTQSSTLQRGTTETARTSEDTTTSSVDRSTTKEQTAHSSEAPQGSPRENTQSQSPVQPEKQVNQDQRKRPSATVRVVGAEGLSFVGNIGSGRELSQVKGTTPEEYELPLKPGAEVITASIRKQEPQDGAIKVEVLREGRMVASKESSGPAGMLNIVWTSQERGDG